MNLESNLLFIFGNHVISTKENQYYCANWRETLLVTSRVRNDITRSKRTNVAPWVYDVTTENSLSHAEQRVS